MSHLNSDHVAKQNICEAQSQILHGHLELVLNLFQFSLRNPTAINLYCFVKKKNCNLTISCTNVQIRCEHLRCNLQFCVSSCCNPVSRRPSANSISQNSQSVHKGSHFASRVQETFFWVNIHINSHRFLAQISQKVCWIKFGEIPSQRLRIFSQFCVFN